MDDRSAAAKIRLTAAAKDYTTDSGDIVHALAPTDLKIGRASSCASWALPAAASPR